MEKIIVLKGIAVPYELQRKNIRRMNLRVHRDGRVLVSAGRDTAQWEIEAFLLGNADFVLQNRERCLKLIEAGDGISAGKNRRYEDGDVLYQCGKACRLCEFSRLSAAFYHFSDTEKSIRCRQTQTDARRVSDTVLPGADGRNL